MGFGSFLGGMGQAAEGMQDAAMATKTMRAKDLYNEAMAGQVREQNFQEQQRRGQLDALRNMQAANFGTVPDPTVGATGTFKPAAQKAPMGDAPMSGGWKTPTGTPNTQIPTDTSDTPATIAQNKLLAENYGKQAQNAVTKLRDLEAQLAKITRPDSSMVGEASYNDRAKLKMAIEQSRRDYVRFNQMAQDAGMSPEVRASFKSSDAREAAMLNPDAARKAVIEATPKSARPTPPAPTAPQGWEKLASAPSQFDPLFQAAATKYGISPEDLKRLAITESSLNPTAVNSKDGNGGSFGLMQINGQHFNGKLTPQQAMDPATNIELGARIWAQALQQAGGDKAKAVQLYKGATTANGISSIAGASQFILGQAPASQQQAQPTQQAAYDTTQSPGVSGQNPNIAQQMWQSQVQLQQIRLRNARTPEEAMDAHGQMLKLHFGKYNSDLEKIARSASMGDSGAMNHLVGQLSGTFFNGQPLHVVQSGGGYVLTSAQGQPVSGKPTDIGTLSSWMLQNLSQSRQEIAMQQQALYAQNYYGEKGKVDAQTPLKLAEIAANHAYDGQKIDMQTAADIKKEIAKHGLESGDIRGVSQNPTGDGWLVYPKTGAPFIVTPGKSVGGMTTDAQAVRVPGMFGANIISGNGRPG